MAGAEERDRCTERQTDKSVAAALVGGAGVLHAVAARSKPASVPYHQLWSSCPCRESLLARSASNLRMLLSTLSALQVGRRRQIHQACLKAPSSWPVSLLETTARIVLQPLETHPIAAGLLVADSRSITSDSSIIRLWLRIRSFGAMALRSPGRRRSPRANPVRPSKPRSWPRVPGAPGGARRRRRCVFPRPCRRRRRWGGLLAVGAHQRNYCSPILPVAASYECVVSDRECRGCGRNRRQRSGAPFMSSSRSSSCVAPDNSASACITPSDDRSDPADRSATRRPPPGRRRDGSETCYNDQAQILVHRGPPCLMTHHGPMGESWCAELTTRATLQRRSIRARDHEDRISGMTHRSPMSSSGRSDSSTGIAGTGNRDDQIEAVDQQHHGDEERRRLEQQQVGEEADLEERQENLERRPYHIIARKLRQPIIGEKLASACGNRCRTGRRPSAGAAGRRSGRVGQRQCARSRRGRHELQARVAPDVVLDAQESGRGLRRCRCSSRRRDPAPTCGRSCRRRAELLITSHSANPTLER